MAKTPLKIAEAKGIAIISSCLTLQQLESAEKFTELFHKKYGDIKSYYNLRSLALHKKLAIIKKENE